MPVRYEQRGNIGLITIDRPERKGALDADGYVQLAEAWRTVASTPTVRVALVTGVKDSFCAGSDLRDFVPEVAGAARAAAGADTAARAAGADTAARAAGVQAAPSRAAGAEAGSRAVLRDVDFPKPIVAAVTGPCLGSGMEMLLATDVRLACPSAVFGIPEVRRGLFSGGGSTVRLPRQVPYAVAMEILLTGRTLGAEEALRCGLINRIVEADELFDRAVEMAERIAANSPTAVQATKRSVLDGLRGGLDEAYAAELRHASRVFASADAQEGPRAFLEKRAPRWEES